MRCYNCNNEFEGNFCPHCGASAQYVNPKPVNQTIKPVKKRMRGGEIAALTIGIIVIVFFVICFIALFFGIFIEHSNEKTIVDNHIYYKGDTVKLDDFTYTLTDYNFEKKMEGDKEDEKYEVLNITIELQNVSDSKTFADGYLGVYADDYVCTDISVDSDYYYYDEGFGYVDILPGKKLLVNERYLVPKNADKVTVNVNCEYDDFIDYGEKTFSFTVR